MRTRIITLLEKAVSKYPNNTRLQALAGKTIANIRGDDDLDMRDLLGEKNGQATSTGTVVQPKINTID